MVKRVKRTQSSQENRRFVDLNGEFCDMTFTLPVSSHPRDTATSDDSVIVIDNGSFRVKAGFSDEIAPRMCFPPTVANVAIKNKKIVLVGNQIQNELPISANDLSSPFINSVVVDFAAMENVFDYVFDTLNKNEMRPVLLSEPYDNPTRHSMAELLFEYYNVPSISFSVDFLLSRFYNRFVTETGEFLGNNRSELKKRVNRFIESEYAESSDLVISVGHNTSELMGVFKGWCDYENATTVPVGGKTLSMYFTESLKTKFPMFAPHFSENVVHEAFTKCCRVETDFDKKIRSFEPITNSKNISTRFEPTEKTILRLSRDQIAKKGFFRQFLADCETDFKKCDIKAIESAFKIKTFSELQITKQAFQILKCVLLRKEDTTLDYPTFLSLLSEFAVSSEENFLILLDVLEKKIRTIEGSFPNLSVQKTTHYDRVKTRERSRKQKELVNKKLQILSSVDECLKDTRTKYWDCSQLIINEILTSEDLRTVISEFKALDPAIFQAELTAEIIKVPEVLFQPHLVGFAGTAGIGQALARLGAIDKRGELFPENAEKSFFLTGATTKTAGFAERVKNELLASFECKSNPVRIWRAEDEMFDAWKGGALLASSDYFKNTTISLSDYEEIGTDAVVKEHMFSGNYKLLNMDEINGMEI